MHPEWLLERLHRGATSAAATAVFVDSGAPLTPAAADATGPVAGRLLELLVWLGAAERVLEIGTFSGHSALVDGGGAAGWRPSTRCELDPERAASRSASSTARRTARGSRCTSARRSRRSSSSTGEFDFVFIDAERTATSTTTRPSLTDVSTIRADRGRTTRSSARARRGSRGHGRVIAAISDATLSSGAPTATARARAACSVRRRRGRSIRRAESARSIDVRDGCLGARSRCSSSARPVRKGQ